jgi:hypothetical protein
MGDLALQRNFAHVGGGLVEKSIDEDAMGYDATAELEQLAFTIRDSIRVIGRCKQANVGVLVARAESLDMSNLANIDKAEFWNMI